MHKEPPGAEEVLREALASPSMERLEGIEVLAIRDSSGHDVRSINPEGLSNGMGSHSRAIFVPDDRKAWLIGGRISKDPLLKAMGSKLLGKLFHDEVATQVVAREIDWSEKLEITYRPESITLRELVKGLRVRSPLIGLTPDCISLGPHERAWSSLKIELRP